MVGGVKPRKFMLVKEPQYQNAQLPILVTLLDTVMLVRELQKANAQLPILVTLFGIVMLLKE